MGREGGRDAATKMNQVEKFLRTAKALLEQAERAASNQRLIMKVGVELGASLDYETTFQSVARLVLADFADWCLVDIVDRQGRVRDVAVAHRVKDKEDLARRLVQKLPQLPSAPMGLRACCGRCNPRVTPVVPTNRVLSVTTWVRSTPTHSASQTSSVTATFPWRESRHLHPWSAALRTANPCPHESVGVRDLGPGHTEDRPTPNRDRRSGVPFDWI